MAKKKAAKKKATKKKAPRTAKKTAKKKSPARKKRVVAKKAARTKAAKKTAKKKSPAKKAPARKTAARRKAPLPRMATAPELKQTKEVSIEQLREGDLEVTESAGGSIRVHHTVHEGAEETPIPGKSYDDLATLGTGTHEIEVTRSAEMPPAQGTSG